jgi:outer membrane protein OmpA-like peptidoglycan-associated protein/Tol biopolymer transport system component
MRPKRELISSSKPSKVLAIRLLFFLVILFAETCTVSAQGKDDPCPMPDNKKAKKLYNQAIDAARSNKAEACKLLSEALELEPEFGRANFVMADLLIKSKKVLEAEPYLLKVIELCPDLDASVYYKLGGLLFGEKKYEGARQNLQRFLDSKTGKETEESDAREMITAATFYIEGFAKPVPFTPTPVSAICTEADEYLAIITPDNSVAYFTRKVTRKDEFSTGKPIIDIERFCSSAALGDNLFERGTPLPAPFNKNDNEGGASLSADNRYMFFTICRKEASEGLNCDIWYSIFSKGIWSEIKNAGPLVNRKDSWDSQPSLSSDGKSLFFASSRPGGYGELDIWKSVRDKNGEWGEPQNLGPSINTKGSEKSPFFHSDGQTLYFSSDGQMGYGGYDIFFSKLDKENNWPTPKNIGYPINSENDDLGFFVSTDGKSGYFASNKLKGSGGWDIYSFPLYKEARPERVLFLKGALTDDNNKAITDGRVELKNTRTKEITTVDVDSITGKYVAVVSFNDDHILTVKQPGKAFSSEYLSTSDSSLNAPKTLNVEVQKIEVGKNYKLNNIYFETNSSVLNTQTIAIIEQLTEFLIENPTVNISIQGHTDNVGDANANLKLSQDRARMVYELLVKNGISSNRLNSTGYGASKPISSNQTEKGRALNRRTEFTITAK